ncbi:MAG: PQQ-binding-like beta-propeller repeat protein [Candidatus Brocadiia bacterium]
MTGRRLTGLFVAALVVAVWTTGLCGEGDFGEWPQWRGPNRDAICTETGLLDEWPEDGPPLLWKMEGFGIGYATVAITGGRLYTTGDLELEGKTDSKGRPVREQFVIAADLATRKIIWTAKVGPPHKDGSRCTPTVDDGLVYAVGTEGDLVCVRAGDGREVWRKSFKKDFGGRMMSGWKYSESPLVDGEKLLCTPGGREATMVALNKKTGEVIWKCAVPDLGGKGRYGAGYSSIVVAEVDGIRQYVQLFGKGVFGAEAESGKFLWGYNRVANSVANITTPIVHGRYVFASTEYDTGSALLKLSRDGDGVKAEEVWWLSKDQFQNHHGGVVLVDGHLYGGTNKNGGPPTCIEFATGEITWQVRPPAGGSAAYLWADGKFIVRYQTGPVTLVKATPEKHEVVSTFRPPRGHGPAWPHPVVCGGRLYLRHRDFLLCYDLRAR